MGAKKYNILYITKLILNLAFYSLKKNNRALTEFHGQVA